MLPTALISTKTFDPVKNAGLTIAPETPLYIEKVSPSILCPEVPLKMNSRIISQNNRYLCLQFNKCWF